MLETGAGKLPFTLAEFIQRGFFFWAEGKVGGRWKGWIEGVPTGGAPKEQEGVHIC